jgi:hypothetical protein
VHSRNRCSSSSGIGYGKLQERPSYGLITAPFHVRCSTLNARRTASGPQEVTRSFLQPFFPNRARSLFRRQSPFSAEEPPPFTFGPSCPGPFLQPVFPAPPDYCTRSHSAACSLPFLYFAQLHCAATFFHPAILVSFPLQQRRLTSLHRQHLTPSITEPEAALLISLFAPSDCPAPHRLRLSSACAI